MKTQKMIVRSLKTVPLILFLAMALVQTGCENNGKEHSAPATAPGITPVYNDSSAPSPDRNFNITIFAQSNTGFPVAGASVNLWYQGRQTTGFTDPEGVFV